MDKYTVLRDYFGYTGFRQGQEKIIDAITGGRDALGIMPTGAGKSVCFQVPAMLLRGVTLVISPLISLMKDQVHSLTQSGVPCTYINASMSFEEIGERVREIFKGQYKLVYIAPERLQSPFFHSAFHKLRVSLVAVDEAHCVSQWGKDFRPSYLKIREFVSGFEKRPVVCAFTATATPRVRDDIEKLLGMENPEKVVTSFDRKNLYFEAVKPKDKIVALKRYLDLYTGKSGIIYCSSRKSVDELYEFLTDKNYSVARYHAGMSASERAANQEMFSFDIRPVIIATNAFGMGIDKPNVSFVIHYNMPGDLESYYQEAGRAGRDGKNADCILFYGGNDVRIQQYFINNPEENDELTDEEKMKLKELRREKLSQMIAYCEGEGCLRKYMLSYFGEKSESCGNCSVCVGVRTSYDVTVAAKRIFNCIRRLGEQQKKDAITDVLKGNLSERVVANGFEKSACFASMRDTAESVISDHIEFFLERGYILVSESGVLSLSQKCEDVLSGASAVRRIDEKKKKQDSAHRLDTVLYVKLRNLRSECARKAGVPDFIILTDTALVHMARTKPESLAELSKIPGVSLSKVQKYGVIFLKLINKHCKENLAKGNIN